LKEPTPSGARRTCDTISTTDNLEERKKNLISFHQARHTFFSQTRTNLFFEQKYRKIKKQSKMGSESEVEELYSNVVPTL
jgi:hypothetical protein